MKQPLCGCSQHEVGDGLFMDGMANLHRSARLGLAVAGEFDARKGGSVNAIPASPATGDHHQVARLNTAVGGIARHDADRPAEDQWVTKVAGVEGDRTGDCRNAHPVAVVTDTGDHAIEQPRRRNHPGGNLLGRGVERRDAKDIEVSQRLGAVAGTEDITNDAAQAGGGTAVGLDCRGVVVGLDLHADVVVAVEPHHA